MLQSCEIFRKAHQVKVPVHGPYHTPYLHSHQDIVDILTPSTCEVFDSLDAHLAVSSSVNGKPVVVTSSIDLLRKSLEEILLVRAHWNLVVDRLVVEASTSTLKQCCVKSIGPTNLVNSILVALKGVNVSHSYTEGHTAWLHQQTPISPTRARIATSNIAIVGMAGRFLDAADHEALWTLLEKGLDMHREVSQCKSCFGDAAKHPKIPKDRFNAKIHYDST